MSLSNLVTSQDFAGNGSSSVPYPISFPFQGENDIQVFLQALDEDDPTVLARHLWSFHTDGSSSWVTTATGIPSTTVVTVARVLELTQPFDFINQGRLDVRTIGQACDRIVMLIQQLDRDYLGGGRLGIIDQLDLLDIVTWNTAADRGAAQPKRRGNIGVQLDDLSLWVAASGAAGDWERVDSGSATAMDSRLCLALIADCGQPGAGQTAVASRLTAMAPDWVLDAGDTSYNAGNPADWSAFLPWITPQKYLRVRGNHSIDTTGEINADAAAFGYLGTNPYWYSKVLGNGLVEIFALDVGRTTAGAFLSPGYSSVGSAQHTWFAAAIAASTARHKIVLLHQPPVTSAGDTSDYCLELDWPELSKADAIFAGHTHLGDWITWRGTPVINLSGAVRMDGASSYVSNGAPGGQVLWVNDTEPLIGRLWITPADVVVEAINTETGRVEFARSIYEKGPRAVQLGGWTHPIGTAVDVGAFLAVPANCIRIHSVLFSFGTASPEWSVELTSDGESVTPPVFCDGTVKLGGSDILFPLIPPGSGLRIEVIPPHPSEYSPPAPATGLYVHIIGDTLS